MIAPKVIFGALGCGALSGAGTTGALFGPAAFKYFHESASDLPEAKAGQKVLFKVSVSEGKSETLECAGEDKKFTTLISEKPTNSPSDYKVKLVCRTSTGQRSPQANEIKLGGNDTEPICKRVSSRGIEQHFACFYKEKDLTVTSKEESGSQKKYLAINWTS
ncbi:hypothetical protein MHLP_01565 [Candidatus Mycoplasma haematolamae str. Purdue]|uniref:Uncharacterized protein n=1 Tax=Mycoplasma haematolamae (strain Purdue) TaxID=1212765 RepID=I7BJ79_MYCHA|nr:hypothetical protein [Candidatus Mycoplasma haematolamae]AFO51893.1 hypothetical protein MHLP_01565 [Candidatus Mycoplasma haematolamae str. Purdue]